jgi:hypothetical protein
MLKPYEKFNAGRFYDEVIAALSPFQEKPRNPPANPADSEYTRARLLEYAARSRHLDALLRKVGAKEFCAADCPRPPWGCCWEYAYRMGNEDFFEFLALQQVEAKRNGWTRPGEKCRYHTVTGCKLGLFKAPVCMRLLCPPLVKMLRRRFGPGADDFLKSLTDISLDIQRSGSILEEMDKAIAAGRRILQTSCT